MSKILVATAVAIMIASAGAASGKVRHHYYRHYMAPNAQMNTPGQPGAYGSPGNMTPGYSSTARTPPTNTNGQ
ncbi:MAG: hypothetical protein JO220_10970 [Hyphomicrobiales bacterium]|nr:hypothetical protein [Hyphomicrobiales bacterium]